jgi:hypothetical protein
MLPVSDNPEKIRNDPSHDIRPNSKGTMESERQKHEYYYDDAHGYETYIPDDDDKPWESNEKKPDREKRPGA